VHILLLHQLFIRPDEPGGTRHFEFCQSLVDSGNRVTILAGTRSYLTGEVVSRQRREVLSPNLEIIRCGTLGRGHRSFFWRAVGFLWFTATSLAAGLRLRDVDLVWGTSPPLLQVASAWALARLRRAPLVFEVRDLWPAFAIAAGVLRSGVLIALSEWLEKFLYRRADHLIVNSPGFIPHLRRQGVPESKISLVPNGVDPGMFNAAADGSTFRAAHGLQGRFIVLYAGAHGLSNDLGVVLGAADILRREGRIVFVFVGDGKEKPRLMQQAAEMGLENVQFLPPVAKEAMPEVLAGADCGLAILKPLRLYATTYPNKVFDYMAAGRPVLLAIDGVIRQVIEEEQAGVVVAPGDAAALAEGVRRLAADPSAARRMGERGRAAVERRFDRRRQAQLLETTFRRVVEARHGVT
jgi:glycosyltransferase involved in cell wall biosynthesis